MKKLCVVLWGVAFLFLGITGIVRAEVVFLEEFEDYSGFKIGGGNVYGYWGVAPLSGTASIPSNFIQGGSQSGNIFFGSFAKIYSGSPAATMTIMLPDLTGYTNLRLVVALAAPNSIWEPSHRDSLHIIGGTDTPPDVDCSQAGCLPVTGAIDSFLPPTYPASLRSQVHSIDLLPQFQDFEYTIDSNLRSVTFAFASTDYPEMIGIDSVRIIAVEPPPSLRGCIKSYGQPLADIEVNLIQEGGKNQTTLTDKDGCYQFENTVPGKEFDIRIKGPVVP